MRYFVDGYNLLFKLDSAENRSFETKRLLLIQELNEIISSLNLRVTLVFDGSMPRPERAVRSHFHDLELVYTPEAQTADAYIISEIERATYPGEIIVITSDKSLASQCRTLGARSQSIHEFIAFLKRKQTKLEQEHREQRSQVVNTTDAQLARYLKIFEERLKG